MSTIDEPTSAKRSVRSALECLATNPSPQPLRSTQKRSTPDNWSAADIFQKPPPLPDSSYDDDSASAVLFLSPPSVKDKERLQQKSAIRSQEGGGSKKKLVSPRNHSGTTRASSSSPRDASPRERLYTSEEVKALINDRISDYEAKRDEEEQRVLIKLVQQDEERKAEISRGHQERSLLKKDNDNLQSQVDILSSQLETAKGERQRGHNVVVESEAAREEMERAHEVVVERLKSQCMDLTQTMEELHVELQEYKKYKQHCAHLEETLRTAQKEAAAMRELDREELHGLEEATLEREEALEAECNLLRSKLADSTAECTKMEKLLEKANGAFMENAKQEKAAESKLLQQEETILELQQSLVAQRRQVATLEQRLSSRNDTRREERDDKERLVAKLEEAHRIQTDELRKKTHRIATLESQRDELRAEMKGGSEGISRLVAVLSEIEESTREVVTVCREGKTDAHIAFTSRRQRGGRSASVPSFVDRLAGRSRSVSPSGDSDQGTNAKKRTASSASEAATLVKEGVSVGSDIILNLHAVTEVVGGAASRSREVLRLKEELQQLRDQCESSEAQRAAIAQSKTMEVAAALNEKSQSDSIRSELEEKTSALLQEHHRVLAELDDVRSTLSRRSEEQSRVLAELDLAKLRYEDSHREAAHLRNTVAELERDLTKERTSTESASSKMLELQQQCDTLQGRMEQAEKEAKAQGSSHERSSKQLKKLSEELARTKDDVETKDKELRSAQTRQRTAETQLTQARKRLAKLSSETNDEPLAPAKNRVDWTRQIEALQKEAVHLRQQLKTLEAEKSSLESQYKAELSEVLSRVESGAASDWAAIEGLSRSVQSAALGIQSGVMEACRVLDIPAHPFIPTEIQYDPSVFTSSTAGADRRHQRKESVSRLVTDLHQGTMTAMGQVLEAIRDSKCTMQFLELEATSNKEQLAKVQERMDALYTAQQRDTTSLKSPQHHSHTQQPQYAAPVHQQTFHHSPSHNAHPHQHSQPAVYMVASCPSPQPREPTHARCATNNTVPYQNHHTIPPQIHKMQPSMAGRSSMDSRHSNSIAGCSVSPAMDGSMSPPPIPSLRLNPTGGRPRRSHSAGSVCRGPSLQLPGHTHDRDVVVVRH